MITNYLKIAFRQLLKNKSFSIINISGLAIGMAAVILILLWISNEASYDNFHVKKDRIYELWNRGKYENKLWCWNTTPKVAARFVKQDLPEVEKAVRVDWDSKYLVSAGDKKITLVGNTVDKEFLDVFTFPLLSGNPKTVLSDGNSILLTSKAAHKLFGSDDVIGKTLTIDNKHNLVVAGVLADPPNNTRFKFEFLIGWNFLLRSGPDDPDWGNNSTRTYVLLKEHATLASAQNKIKVLRKKYQDPRDYLEMFLYPVDRWQLYSSFENGVEKGGWIEYVRLFAIISILILVIACINFMNLSTARSEKRAREVGIRKTVGAGRGSLVRQFFGESLVMSFLSFLLALVLVHLSLPSFNRLIGRELSVDYTSVFFWCYALAFIGLTGLLAGSYPAFFLSSFKPVNVLKGTFKAANALIAPRKILVVVQFTFAIVLIICAVIVKQQIRYVQQRQAGYQKDNLIYVYLTDDLRKNYALVRQELLSTGAARDACRSNSPISQGWSDSWGFEWQGKDPDDKTDFDYLTTDEHLVSTAGLQLVKGRDLNLSQFPSDSLGMILNESAVKAMHFKEPIGQVIKYNDHNWHVVGVISDFILRSPYNPTRPMIIGGCKSNWLNVIHVRLNNNGLMSEHLKKIESIFKKYNPAFPFEYRFISEEYEQKFNSEKRISALSMLFTGLTILISCLGLFGLATYMAQNRIKEIGVRKVLGASVMHITVLLSVNFLKLVLMAFIIAIPLSWWFMHSWLNNYAYHVALHWWVFLLAGAASFFIAAATISYQAIKAAVSNPVKSLRTE